MRNLSKTFLAVAVAGILSHGSLAAATEAGITLLDSQFSEGGCDAFGGCGSSLWGNRLQLTGENLADVRVCGTTQPLTLTWSNPFDQTLDILDMPTENDQSRSVREVLKQKGQATVTGTTAATLEGVCVELFDAAGTRLARTVLHHN